MTPDLVSVVMPVGSVDDDLRFQFEALAGQTYAARWELVISRNTAVPTECDELDRLLEQVAGLGDGGIPVRIVDSSTRRSAAHARNVGANAATGEFLLFCDGDDIADSGWMEALVGALGANRAVGGHLEEELLGVPGQQHWRPPATPGALPSFLGVPYLVSANMGIHRQDFLKTEGFDTELVRGEDIAFSWDLLDARIEPVYCASAIVHYRHRKGLRAMMFQHYLYGRGFSQLLARRGVPGAGNSTTGLAALRPNGQPVARKTFPYFLRRGSIAAGRVVGVAVERSARVRSDTDAHHREGRSSSMSQVS